MSGGPRISDSKDLYWLAGLLEGEGSFMKPSPSAPNNPRISIQSKDKDIAVRVAGVFGVTYFAVDKRQNPNWNDTYKVIVAGTNAVKLMQVLYPLMGERRRLQIEAACQGKAVFESNPMDDSLTIYWMAGLLEGEGSFLQGPPSTRNQPRIQIQMTDKDILEKVAKLWGVKVRGPYTPSNPKPHWKHHYTLVKKGTPAIEWMQQLRPLMGERRQGQIDAAIGSYVDKRGPNHPNVKLTVEQVREIRRRLAEGERLTKLAAEFSVDKGLIWQIKARRAWKKVN